MTATAAQRALARRVRALARDLPAVLDDDVEALHRSRVASRRLREILPVLGLDRLRGHHAPVRKLRRRLRHLTSALGGVRELDVALGILDALGREHPGLGVVLSRARRAVERDRRECRDDMARQMEKLQADALLDSLARLIDRAARSSARARARLLRRRLDRRVNALERAVRDAGSLFAVDRLHEVRIAAKKTRYVLESIDDLGAAPTRRLVSRFKQFQDLLGRLHDLEVVLGYVRRQGESAASETGARARAIDRIEGEIRDLHARYLGQLDLLDAVLSACRSDVDKRLAAAPPGPAREKQSWPMSRASTSSGTRSPGSGARSTRTTRAGR